MLVRFLPALIVGLFTVDASAFIFDVNGFYFSDSFAPGGATATTTYTNYDIRLGFTIDKKQRFFAGWNYSGVSSSAQTEAGTTQFTSSEMGPSFLWALNKDRTWIISFSYNLVSTATYTAAGGSPEKWKGATMKIYLGYNIEVSESWFVGPTLNYYSANFNEKIIDETTYSAESNTRTEMYPALYFGYRF